MLTFLHQFHANAKGKFQNGRYPKPPTYWVENDLSRAMKGVINKARFSGKMYVYYGKECSGKSVAAGATIWSAIQMFKDYPYLYIDAGDSLRENMRLQLGVPDSILSDLTWVDFLFDAASKTRKRDEAKEEKPSPLSWDRIFDAMSKYACLGTDTCTGELEGTDVVSKVEYVNVVENIPPIIVLDNIRALDAKSSGVLHAIFQAAERARVIVFVLTNNEMLANYICGMNGKQRVLPLPNRYAVEDGQADWSIEKEAKTIPGGNFGLHNFAKHIVWIPSSGQRAH